MEKRTSKAAVRGKLGQFDTFPASLLSRCWLPLSQISLLIFVTEPFALFLPLFVSSLLAAVQPRHQFLHFRCIRVPVGSLPPHHILPSPPPSYPTPTNHILSRHSPIPNLLFALCAIFVSRIVSKKTQFSSHIFLLTIFPITIQTQSPRIRGPSDFPRLLCFMGFWFGLEILRLVYKKAFFKILNCFYLIWPFYLLKIAPSLIRAEKKILQNLAQRVLCSLVSRSSQRFVVRKTVFCSIL